jgi:hypothetical protein
LREKLVATGGLGVGEGGDVAVEGDVRTFEEAAGEAVMKRVPQGVGELCKRAGEWITLCDSWPRFFIPLHLL